MPGFDGLILLESLDHKPQVILNFGTLITPWRHSTYDVTDYLQKPLDKSRFDVSIKKRLIIELPKNAEGIKPEFIIYVNSITWKS